MRPSLTEELCTGSAKIACSKDALADVVWKFGAITRRKFRVFVVASSSRVVLFDLPAFGFRSKPVEIQRQLSGIFLSALVPHSSIPKDQNCQKRLSGQPSVNKY